MDQLEEFLINNKWPLGLRILFRRNLSKFALRFFIIDDSGSMMTCDGNRLVDSGSRPRYVQCSRWQELTESMRFHTALSIVSSSPSEFRFLNRGTPVVLGAHDEFEQQHYQTVLKNLEESPNGGTPINKQIMDIIDKIKNVEHMLRSNNQLACVVIATDGVPSDGNIAHTINRMKDMPVWVVIRLCTDDSAVTEFWNNIDKEIELNLEILDDVKGEGEEVQRYNPWLNYTEPIHRLREFGLHIKEFDRLDEKPLSKDEVKAMVSHIFGLELNAIPDPHTHWNEFIKVVKEQNQKNNFEWIKVTELNRVFNNSCAIL